MRKTLHEFVIEQLGWIDNVNFIDHSKIFDPAIKCFDFTKLTNRAPKLGDFIPCDKDGNVLEEPYKWVDGFLCPDGCDKTEWNQYQQAKSRVIFAGDWDVVAGSNCVIYNGELMFRITSDFTDVIRSGIIEKSINRIEDLPLEIEFKEGVI